MIFKSILDKIKRFCTPLEVTTPREMRYYSLSLTAVFLMLWAFIKLPFIPRLGEVLTAFSTLWSEQGLATDAWISLKLNFYALSISTICAFGISYLYTIPAIRPFVQIFTKIRFLGFTGLVFVFTLYIGTGMKLRLSLALFAIFWFYLTALVAIVRGIKNERYQYAYTLRMSRWRTVWEIVVLGTMHEALITMVQFAAYGWAILTAVEGYTRSLGGLGVMVLNSDKHMQISHIFAIVFFILICGIIIDFVLTALIRRVCSYAYIGTGDGK